MAHKKESLESAARTIRWVTRKKPPAEEKARMSRCDCKVRLTHCGTAANRVEKVARMDSQDTLARHRNVVWTPALAANGVR